MYAIKLFKYIGPEPMPKQTLAKDWQERILQKRFDCQEDAANYLRSFRDRIKYPICCCVIKAPKPKVKIPHKNGYRTIRSNHYLRGIDEEDLLYCGTCDGADCENCHFVFIKE